MRLAQQQAAAAAEGHLAAAAAAQQGGFSALHPHHQQALLAAQVCNNFSPLHGRMYTCQWFTHHCWLYVLNGVLR